MLAELYHAHHSLYAEDLPFWLGLAAEHGGPILELGSGTGRVLAPLAKAGHESWGIDRDAAMLAVLRAQAEGEVKERVTVVEGDISKFDLGAEFSLILLPCNTYNTLNGEERLQTLGCVRKHLKAGGIFALSMPNPELLSEQFDPGSYLEDIITHPHTSNPIQVSSECTAVAEGVQVSWHYDHLLPNGNVQRHTLTVKYQNTSIEAYLEEFAQAGFAVQAQYGDFDGSPYEADAPYLILVTQQH